MYDMKGRHHKRNLCLCLILCLTASFLLGGCHQEESGNIFTLDYVNAYADGHEDNHFTLQDGGTTLTVAEKDLEITLERGDTRWSSYLVPPEGLSDNKILSEYKALLNLTYYSGDGVQGTMSSWTDCILRNQYTVEETENGIEIMLVLGQAETERALPRIIRREELDGIMASISSSRIRKKLAAYYKLYNLEDAEDEAQRRAWLEEYPALEQQPLYILRSGVTDKEVRELEGYFVEAGYTKEQAAAEHELLGYESELGTLPIFRIYVELSLDNGQLIARVPTDRIEYDDRTYLLNRLTLLPHLLSLPEGAQGSLFVPDGCGALIDIDGKAKVAGRITRRVYGSDPSVDTAPDDYPYLIPAYGICAAPGAMLTVIEEGDAMCEITAAYAGTINKAASVYSSFICREYSTKSLSAGESGAGLNLGLFDKSRPTSDYTLRFIPLGEDNSYVGLAKAFQDYLVEKQILTPWTDAHFYADIETLGSVTVDERVFVFDTQKTYPLTTFEQDREMIDALRKQGEWPIRLLLKGAANGGLAHKKMDSYQPVGALGGKKGLESLLSSLDDSVTVLPEVSPTMVYHTGGFYASKQAARRLNNFYTNLGIHNIATGQEQASRFVYAFSPAYILKNMAGIRASLQKLGCGDYLLSGIGDLLYSDAKTATNRQDTLAIIRQMLADQPHSSSISGGAFYTWAASRFITGLPMEYSAHQDMSRQIPFLQMVLHGYIGYSAQALNLSGSFEEIVLRCAETGTMPRFTFAADNTSHLTQSGFSQYYSVDFTDWEAEAANAIRQLEAVLAPVASQTITGHRQVAEGVYETSFGSARILVNYTQEKAVVGNITLAARSFQLIS